HRHQPHRLRRSSAPSMVLSRSGRAVRILDAALVIWIGAWIWMGVAIGREVSNLTSLSDTVVTAGQAVRETGQALKNLEGLPFVGERIAPVQRRIAEAGNSAVLSGEQSSAGSGWRGWQSGCQTRSKPATVAPGLPQ